MKLAMWSGPRNLSTAMMYAFAQRADFAAWDEPFYAAYLAATGFDHPMRDEVVTAGMSNAEDVARACSGPVPEGRPNWYLKVMPHHMVDGFPIDWAGDCVNVHLIRHPARVVASYVEKRESVTLDDIGFRQQHELFGTIGGHVIDSADIRDAPRQMLELLCDAIGLDFDPVMLSWPRGGNPADGIWAPHWYKAVHDSTGFAGPEGALPELSGTAAMLVDEAMSYYTDMREKRLRL